MENKQSEKVKDWLIALRAPSLAGRKLIEAVELAGGIERLRANASVQRKLGLSEEARSALDHPDPDLLLRDQQWLNEERHHLITWDSEVYPALLRRIPSPPAALFVDGDPEVLWQPQIAVIGSRNPTPAGLDHARGFSAEFSRLGMTVTSGLASGIDSAAHDAALGSGGRTIAVTGTGLDIVYPKSSRALATEISRGGALASEFPPGSPPLRAHFPSRNRIISGLSLGVLVVEAGLNSGSLITARHAAEQGRDVFALPGSIHNPMVKGCHRLIREGARLVEKAEDVMSELSAIASALAVELKTSISDPALEPGEQKIAGQEIPDDPDYRKLWAALEFDPLSVDELVRLTGLGVQSVSSMLLMLELRGQVAPHSSGRYSRKSLTR